jgi:hypothetical protein
MLAVCETIEAEDSLAASLAVDLATIVTECELLNSLALRDGIAADDELSVSTAA